MIAEAASAGFVKQSAHGRTPRLQIVTVEDLLEGKMPRLPPLPQPSSKPLAAVRAKNSEQLELLLPFEGKKIAPSKGDFIDPRFVAVAG
jgi:site-specific DNA-methyltransferase (adenine-specific)